MSHKEAADYISAILEGLTMVASGARMPFLAYLIGIALEEARQERTRKD